MTQSNSQNRPLISVVMSAFNASAYLRESIESILTQTYRNFEFLIIDDGSSDETALIVSEYRDPRIRFQRQSNRGLTETLNTLLAEANGEYIARMDADDVSLPERFHDQLNHLEANGDVVALGTAAHYVDRAGRCLFRRDRKSVV